MANLFPSVSISETDKNTTISASQPSTYGAFVGNFEWGPVEDIITISNEGELVDTFGKPNDDTYKDFFVAKTFLDYSASLKTVRVVDESSRNAVSTLSTDAEFIASNNEDNYIIAYCDSGVDLSSNVVISTNIYGVWNDYISEAPSTTDECLSAEGSNDEIYLLVIDKTTDQVVEEYTDDEFLSKAADSERYYKNVLLNSEYITAGSHHILDSDGEKDLTTDFTAVGSDSSEPIGDDSSVLVKNDDDYLDATLTGSGSFIGRYPGEKGNGLYVTYCDSGLSDLSSYISVSDTEFGKWSDYFETIPGTSINASQNGGSNDEIHIIIIDKEGKFSGIKGTVLEKYSYVSKAIDAKKEDGTSNYYKNIINSTSKYIRTGDLYVSGASSTSDVATEFSGQTGYSGETLSGGVDPISPDYSTGYELFNDIKSVDVSHIIAGDNTPTVKKELVAIAENRGDSMAHIAPSWDNVKLGLTQNTISENIETFKNTDIGMSSSYYFASNNWKQLYDKYNDVYRWIPCSADTAGLSARCDVTDYPWYSFGGYNRGILRNVVKLAWNPKDEYMGENYKIGVNPIINEGGTYLLLGDKTGLTRNSSFSRANVRKLFNVLKISLKEYAKYGLFEFNDEFTRDQIRSEITSYLNVIKSRRGIIEFRVVVDETNNTATVIDSNELVIDIYIKANKSTNWIKLNMISVGSSVSFNEILAF